VVVDIANETAYTVPALGQSGYEKIMPINPGHSDYVLMVMAGCNHGGEPAPLRLYVGKKGVDANNQKVDQNGSASQRDKFLARNGLLYGKIQKWPWKIVTLPSWVFGRSILLRRCWITT
jgi:hypothetical protein